jgi:DNA polymerase-3 subunit gamma/tau
MAAPEPVAEPEPATPPAEPTPAAEVAAAGGQLDAAGVRRVWEQVLDAVGRRSRSLRALLANAQVTAVTGGEVTVSFSTAPLARLFDKGDNPTALREALAEVLGVDWTVRAVADGAPVPSDEPASGGAHAAPASPRPAPAESFAPGDEPAPDDPEAPAPAGGDDPAMALLRAGLGAQVISRSEDG